jgi:heme-degrading monooxygenase HmoA
MTPSFATMASVHGPDRDFDEVVKMAAESLLPWIRQYDGYQGMFVLGDSESGRAHFVTLWDTMEALEKSAHGRAQVRERLAETAGATIESTGNYTLVMMDVLE